MKIQLLPSEFVHLDNLSTYNHNYFSAKKSNMSIIILEICHEYYDFFEYRLLDGENQIFMGCSENSLSGDKIIDVDFLYYYT